MRTLLEADRRQIFMTAIANWPDKPSHVLTIRRVNGHLEAQIPYRGQGVRETVEIHVVHPREKQTIEKLWNQGRIPLFQTLRVEDAHDWLGRSLLHHEKRIHKLAYKNNSGRGRRSRR